MGYTHYMRFKPVTQKVWNKILKDCQTLYKNMPAHSESAGGYYKDKPLALSDWDGTTDGEPEFNKDEICFNGVGGMGHESFRLGRAEPRNDFCKTARKPYDLMVCACLIVRYFHSPDTIEIGSDGDEEDWAPALKFVHDTLTPAHAMAFKLT